MNKTELFNKITRNKQRNQSQCDQMKVLNTKSSIISYILTERGELRSNQSFGFNRFNGFDNIVEVGYCTIDYYDVEFGFMLWKRCCGTSQCFK